MSDPLYNNMRWVENFLNKVRKNRKDMNKKAILELLKSSARFIWFGLLGLVVVALTALVGSPELVQATVSIGGLDVSVGVVLIAVIGSVAKAIDRYIHTNQDIKSNGIAPTFLQK